MKKEDIEKAAREYVMPTAYIIPLLESIAAKEGFIHGASWRINSVWHDASEKPEKKPALVEYSLFPKGNGYLVVPDPREVLGSITRYAYIEDLIPNKEK